MNRVKANEVLRTRFLAAKSFIDEKNYEEARNILNAIDHPRAKEWLEKLKALDPSPDQGNIMALIYKATETETKNRRAKTRPASASSVTVVILCLVAIIGVLLLFALVFNPQAWSLNRPDPTVAATATEFGAHRTNVNIVAPTPTNWFRLPTADTSYSFGGTLCGDGSYSSSTGSGTCSHHQGVAGSKKKR